MAFDDIIYTKRKSLQDIELELVKFIQHIPILDILTYQAVEIGISNYLLECVNKGIISGYSIEKDRNTIFKITLIR